MTARLLHRWDRWAPFPIVRWALGTRVATAILVGIVLALGMPSQALDVGAPVALSGQVTDLDGKALAGAQVTFEVSRRSLSLRRLGKVEENLRRFSAVTDSLGSYTISWPWDPYFNSFVLTVGIPRQSPVRSNADPKAAVPSSSLDPFERREIDGRKIKGGSVVENFALVRAGKSASSGEFAATLSTDDERRVHAEMGSPDEVRVIEFPERREVTWWYFERGRAYRFESGSLAQVIHFEPVTRF